MSKRVREHEKWVESGGLNGEVDGNRVIFTFPNHETVTGFSEWIFQTALEIRDIKYNEMKKRETR